MSKCFRAFWISDRTMGDAAWLDRALAYGAHVQHFGATKDGVLVITKMGVVPLLKDKFPENNPEWAEYLAVRPAQDDPPEWVKQQEAKYGPLFGPQRLAPDAYIPPQNVPDQAAGTEQINQPAGPDPRSPASDCSGILDRVGLPVVSPVDTLPDASGDRGVSERVYPKSVTCLRVKDNEGNPCFVRLTDEQLAEDPRLATDDVYRQEWVNRNAL